MEGKFKMDGDDRDESYQNKNALSASFLNSYEQGLEGVDRGFLSPRIFAPGTEVHRRILEPDKPAQTRYKSSEAELEKMDNMEMALRNNKMLTTALDMMTTVTEKMLYNTIDIEFNDEMVAVPFKGIVDVLTKDAIIDLKTTSCKSIGGFIKSCASFNYYSQMEIYKQLAGVKNAYILGVNKNGGIFMVNTSTSIHKTRMVEARFRIQMLTEAYLHEKGTKWITDGKV